MSDNHNYRLSLLVIDELYKIMCKSIIKLFRRACIIPISSSKARADFFSLIDTVNQSHEPVLITDRRGNAVLISEEDWYGIEETLYLNAIPDMAKSICKGIQTDNTDCIATPAWK